MPFFPSFRRPCPYQANLSAVMDGAWCRMCGQQVHDITDWSDAERVALLRRCGDEVCVSYRVPVAALAAAALATTAAPAMAGPKHAHHPRPTMPPEPMVTLAGAPVPVPPETTAPPPADAPQRQQSSSDPASNTAGTSSR